MTVSIIIPTVGRETLKLVLDKLFLNNNFDQINPEIIVIFDGKPQKTLKKLKNDRILFLETGKKVGASGARNLGIEKAKGEVLIFIGDDTIPEPDWLQKIYDWHQQNQKPEQALLGKVDWVDELADDAFHQWLNENAQFDFKNLDKGGIPSWKHFYTSNISLKKEAIKDQRFNQEFQGWGFEDAEFGYRLTKEGLKLSYDSSVLVKHDDRQTLEGMVKRTTQSRKNAALFETLHPEIKILPGGFKKIVLRILIFKTMPLVFIDQIKWWRAWKKAWLGI